MVFGNNLQVTAKEMDFPSGWQFIFVARGAWIHTHAPNQAFCQGWLSWDCEQSNHELKKRGDILLCSLVCVSEFCQHKSGVMSLSLGYSCVFQDSRQKLTCEIFLCLSQKVFSFDLTFVSAAIFLPINFRIHAPCLHDLYLKTAYFRLHLAYFPHLRQLLGPSLTFFLFHSCFDCVHICSVLPFLFSIFTLNSSRFLQLLVLFLYNTMGVIKHTASKK